MLTIKNLNISYNETVFKNQSLEIKNNCVTLIEGESGCGKTTLLYQLGLIDNDLKCDYYIDDINISSYNDKQKANIRKYHIGFVFQDYMLYDHFNVYDNLQYYAAIIGKNINETEAMKYLSMVHLDIPLDRPLMTLSGGQKQRLAIACALIKEPEILILDEPTSALDIDHARNIFEILDELKQNRTIILTSHNKEAFHYCDEVIEIKDKVITKIKEVNIDDTKHYVNNNDEKISFSTLRNYMKKQVNSSKKQKILIMFLNLFILAFSVGIVELTSYYTMKTQSIISQDSQAQIYIHSTNIDEFKDVSTAIYPYNELTLSILDMEYQVVPYYDESNISDKIWSNYSIGNEKGFYFSNAMYLGVRDMIVPQEYIDFKKTDNTDVSLKYKGILFKDVNTIYSQNDNYLLLYYTMIDELKDNEIKGLTVFVDSYEKYNEIKKRAEELNLEISVSSELEEIEEVMIWIQNLKYIITILMIVISMIALYFVYNSYFNARRNEMVLLKCIGLTRTDMALILFGEAVILNIIGFIIIGFITMIMGYSFIELIIIEIIILLIIYLLIQRMVCKMNPVKILRN